MKTAELKEALKELVMAVNYYLDPDEPQDEWIDGVYRALDKANKLIGE
jgi:hypothetical protein